MIRIRKALVIDVLEESENYQELLVKIEGKTEKAINYPPLTGFIEKGERVYLNTTAVSLGLGTGGYHFVLASANMEKDALSPGHIMKMRYSPQQIKVLAVEEESSPYHEEINKFSSLNNIPVVITFLHSMLIPALAGIRSVNEKLEVSYIMTDGGALPLAFSKNVRLLEKAKWLKGTVTAGHAFGGHLEAVNVYSALAAAFTVQKPQIIIIGMGPGNVGTGTQLGTTAVEVGQIINAAASLGGRPIVIPRISFQDKRSRHQGLSHHVLTVLNKIALASSTVVIPILEEAEKKDFLKKQIDENKLTLKHTVVYESGQKGLDYLKETGFDVTTMGRSLIAEREFFLTACAAGTYAAKLI
ncbi:MAG: DUF3866 family protein [Clostridia bacterium]|nr:DUF3866 family protein [Clostridia bacterium]